jgi:hypothetical protein
MHIRTGVYRRCLSSVFICGFRPALTIAEIQSIFPENGPISKRIDASAPRTNTIAGRDKRDHLFIEPIFTRLNDFSLSEDANNTKSELHALFKQHNNLGETAAAFIQNHARDTKAVFYPLVSQLLQICGFRSENSRAGVNYQRWDACVWLEKIAIPIEIKSPTEERELSTKSVRQALENKIISLSRGGIDERREVTSLIVGFAAPAERSEMANLIDNIYFTYGLSIGVITLTSLAKLALRALIDNEMITPIQLENLKGFIDA